MVWYLDESRYRAGESIQRENGDPSSDEERYFCGTQVVRSDLDKLDLSAIDKFELPNQSVSWVDIRPGNIVGLPDMNMYMVESIYGPYGAIGASVICLTGDEEGEKFTVDAMKGYGKITRVGDRDDVVYDDFPYAFPVSDRLLCQQLGLTHQLVTEEL